ncbi:MAG TPA: MBL fold metallo-hydrolase [Gemmataceae bacterium]
MKVMLVPSALGAGSVQYLTTLLVNGTVAFDAGSLGLHGTPADQARVRDVFLTHAHMDHVASLPIFLENVSDDSADCPTVHAPQAVLDVIHTDVLNDRLFPDFVRLSAAGPPLVKLEPLTPGRPVHVAGLTVTAAAVDHAVPTVAYLIDDGTSAIAFVTDTAPTEAIWHLANCCPRLKAVFLELTFPEGQAWLAGVAKHLTPRLFAAEVAKVRPGVPVYAVHLKARFRDRLLAELDALGLAHVTVLEPGRVVEV